MTAERIASELMLERCKTQAVAWAPAWPACRVKLARTVTAKRSRMAADVPCVRSSQTGQNAPNAT